VTDTGLDWLLTRFTRENPSVWHAAAVSADGLALATSGGIPAGRVDQLAAIASGLAGLTIGAAACLAAGGVRQTVVDMQAGLLLVVTVSDRAHLVVLAAAQCDLGQVSYETAMLARRVGAALGPGERTSAGVAHSGGDPVDRGQ
jgi:predicted regulator of Ras-like GTPase activity (Roadblock/LC7/MglB family)